jgi:7-carboxy-7-deazaguanine synthase (Cx14CxxC type)
MTYSVKEIFYTLQGEGAQSGRPAVFCRFAGCNLWSGLERDRAQAVCKFCDTDFVGTDGQGGGKFSTASDLARSIARLWPAKGESNERARPLVVCTGGEPLLQLDEALIDAMHAEGFEIAVETNGTVTPPRGIDWTCVSPKAGSEVVVRQGDELKLVFPQEGAMPERFLDWNFRHFFLQPMDGPHRSQFTSQAVDYCKSHPQWRLSLQTHKILGIP